MIIEKANKRIETREERAKRLYQVGNVVENCGDLYLVISVEDGYALYGLKIGSQTSSTYITLSDLANVFYGPTNKLVTKLTYETED